MTSPALPIEFELTDEKPKAESTDFAFGYWAAITQKIAEGDTHQFAKYYDAFFDLMFVEAKRLTNYDESQCLDIVQDSMLKAIKSLRKIDSYQQVAMWTRTLVKSVVYDRIRNEVARQKRDQDYSQQSRSVDDWEQSTELLDKQARLVWIEQQVKELDPALQKMFQLRFRLGWSLVRIAKFFRLKTGAVDGRIRRAIDKIKHDAKNQYESNDK